MGQSASFEKIKRLRWIWTLNCSSWATLAKQVLKGAVEGTSAAAARLVLPAYVKLLHVYCVVTAVAGGVTLIQAADRGTGEVNAWLCRHLNQFSVALAAGLNWGLLSVMFEGLSFFLMQKSAGSRAFRRGFQRSLMVGSLVFCTAFMSAWLEIKGAQTWLGEDTENLAGAALHFTINLGGRAFPPKLHTEY